MFAGCPKLKKRRMAEGEGFEPSIPCGIRAFQARALGHYATLPMINKVTLKV